MSEAIALTSPGWAHRPMRSAGGSRLRAIGQRTPVAVAVGLLVLDEHASKGSVDAAHWEQDQQRRRGERDAAPALSAISALSTVAVAWPPVHELVHELQYADAAHTHLIIGSARWIQGSWLCMRQRSDYGSDDHGAESGG
jgi:hypothetical protein